MNAERVRRERGNEKRKYKSMVSAEKKRQIDGKRHQREKAKE